MPPATVRGASNRPRPAQPPAAPQREPSSEDVPLIPGPARKRRRVIRQPETALDPVVPPPDPEPFQRLDPADSGVFRPVDHASSPMTLRTSARRYRRSPPKGSLDMVRPPLDTTVPRFRSTR